MLNESETKTLSNLEMPLCIYMNKGNVGYGWLIRHACGDSLGFGWLIRHAGNW